MGRYGSGKDTTDGYKRIDVRFLRKRGYLIPGAMFSLSWSRNGQPSDSIQCRTSDDAVILAYKHRRGEWEEWKSEEYSARLCYSRCNFAANALGSCVLPEDAGEESRCFICVVGSLPVGIAISLSTSASMRPRILERFERRKAFTRN